MDHSGEIMLAAQQNMSGGQSMSLWNVFAAPFAAGRSYEDIKQCMQMLIYNLNMAYAARGSQVPFTSMSLEFTVPSFLKNVEAYGPSGKVVGTYDDYEEEVRQIQRAFTDVLYQGDAYGKPHLFPNTIYTLRKEMMNPEFEDDLAKVHQLSSKYGTPYFSNMLVDYRGKNKMANYMGCRTCLNNDWTGDWERDTLRTGNASYVTMNLPRLAYKYGKNKDVVYEELETLLDDAAEIMMLRLEGSKKCLDEYNLLSFLKQDMSGEPYYRIENATVSFGFVGLNEYLLAMTEHGLGYSNEVDKEGVELIEFINKIAKEKSEETGLRFSVLQTPAESTAHRFALSDQKQFGERAILQGTHESPYYTNSAHTPVNSDKLLPSRIKTEEKFHPLTKGGHIFHVWLGEAYSNPSSLMSLTKKIACKSNIGFWAYSSVLSYCMNCKTMMKGKQNTCATCQSKKTLNGMTALQDMFNK